MCGPKARRSPTKVVVITMVLPKKGRVWTYKERARFWALIGSLPVVFFLVFGIYRGSWPIVLVALLALAGASMMLIASERKYRDEP